MTPAGLARRLRAFRGKVWDGLAAAEKQTGDDARRMAIQQSSGPLSLAALADAGHPFSRARPNAAYDPSVINVQTGVFRASWQEPTQKITASTIETRVINTSPEAKYLSGTDRMVPRPIAAAVLQQIAPVRKRRLERAIASVVSRF